MRLEVPGIKNGYTSHERGAKRFDKYIQYACRHIYWVPGIGGGEKKSEKVHEDVVDDV